jgi:membrane fusion protein, multidrug efflux system
LLSKLGVKNMTNQVLENNTHKNSIRYAVGFLALVALACFIYWFGFIRGTVYSDDARIDGTLIDLSPQISGVLDTVNVQEGDGVQKGQVMFTLDRNLLQASVLRAKADMASSRETEDVTNAMYIKAVHGPLSDEIRIAETAVKKALSDLNLEESNWKRVGALYEEKLVSTADRDRVRSALDNARHRYEDATQRLELLKKGTRSEDLLAAKSATQAKTADLESAKARLAQAEINLGYSDVTSPFSGLVVRRWKDPGDTISAGTPVLSILDPSSLHIEANIEEKNLYKIHPGDSVEIRIDAFPKARLKGRVDKILLATNSKFSLVPSEGVSGTFIKVAQRVPLKIVFDTMPELSLGPGLSVEVRIRYKSVSSADNKTVK